MHPILRKTFGGLSTKYYVRQLLFGAVIATIFLYALSHAKPPVSANPATYGLVGFNTLLYPYARFVYESIVDYIVGANVFIFPALLMLGVKLITIVFCWVMALFIAPIGLLYLYVHHSSVRID